MKLSITLFLVLQIVSTQSQILIPKKDYVPEIRQSRYSYAVSLITAANSEPVSFGIMRQNPDSTHEIIHLTKDSFIRQASGFESSRANPDKINFFEKYSIEPRVLEKLWRLKFDANPYDSIDEIGWGTKLGVPSNAQFDLLKEFGINSLTDYAYGEKVWMLLVKVNDPLWTASYQLRK
jgi:hypothetical protein